MNLESVVDLLPPRPDPNVFFQTLSVFTLTSWQDPFPLVVLENMALGTPVLAFNGSGGACEAIEGCVVPVEHFSPLAMAEAIAHYYLDPDARQRDGDCCCERIRTVYNPEIIIPQFREELLRLGSG